MPSASELPNIISTIRHPGRRASISVGPQSEADAYEALAFRQRKRRESLSSVAEASSGRAKRAQQESKPSQKTGLTRCVGNENGAPISPASRSLGLSTTGHLGDNLRAHPVDPNINGIVRTPSQNRREDEKDKKEIFSKLEKPRVRYDVEVITKMIVYSGELHPVSSCRGADKHSRYCLAGSGRKSTTISLHWLGDERCWCYLKQGNVFDHWIRLQYFGFITATLISPAASAVGVYPPS